MNALAWAALRTVLAAEGTSTPILVALITAGFSFAGMVFVAVKTFRIERGKTDLEDFREMRATWKAEIAELRDALEEARSEITELKRENERLHRDRDSDQRRIRNLEAEVEAGHRREVDLMQRLGLSPRSKESRDRSGDD